ncbi:MAG TPA: NIPSNAP family protein [Bryobacteraceae bacterium]|nr:NIPSNAP family protein [Bryobacteraceae bacterium]
MNRRSLLSWLGASAASTLTPLSAVTAARPRVLSLESFHVTHPDRMPLLHNYLGRAILPVLYQIHDGPKMFLEAIVAPQTPQTLFLATYSSFDEMLDIRGRIATHPGIRQARADLESAHVLDQVQSQVLLTTHESLRFATGSNRLQTGVFELRSYHAPAWQDGPPARVSAVLHRTGIHPIVNASTAVGEHLPRFTYLIAFESLAARQEAWARLDADPAWIDIQRESLARYGSAAKVTGKSIYKLAPYCQWA